MGKTSIIKYISKGTKGLKTGAIAGAGTFFGFEWLTNGGMTDAVSGTLGVSQTASSVLLIVGALVGGALLVWYILGRTTKRRK